MMTTTGISMKVVLLFAAGIACVSGTATAQDGRGTASVAPVTSSAREIWQTQLFNLLQNEKSILDHKNRHQATFAARFDALLTSSRLAKADKSGISLKKRLLSGPAAQGEAVQDPASGTEWRYYEACQAHACDETWLSLLYDPRSRTMISKLSLNKQVEYLGAPSDDQKRLLDRTRSAKRAS